MIVYTKDLEVSDVGMEGEGLVFIVYSDAIASMPGSFFWAILFFFMLITLGVDRSGVKKWKKKQNKKNTNCSNIAALSEVWRR